jgi:hypothetical protein
MSLSFVCPNCRKVVDPMSSNARMSTTTKLWQHNDCAAAPERKTPEPEVPSTDRRKRPRR